MAPTRLEDIRLHDGVKTVWVSSTCAADFRSAWGAISTHIGFTPEDDYVQYEIDQSLSAQSRHPKRTSVVLNLFNSDAQKQILAVDSTIRATLEQVMKEIYTVSVKHIKEELGRESSHQVNVADATNEAAMKHVPNTSNKLAAIVDRDLKSYVLQRITSQPIRGLYQPDPTVLDAVVPPSTFKEMQKQLDSLRDQLQERSDKNSISINNHAERIYNLETSPIWARKDDVAVTLTNDAQNMRKELDSKMDAEDMQKKINDMRAEMEAKMADMQKQIDGSKDPFQRNDDQIGFVPDTKGAHPQYLNLMGRVEKLEGQAAEDGKAIKEFRSLNAERTLTSVRFHFTSPFGAIAKLANGDEDVKIVGFPQPHDIEEVTRKRKRGFGEEEQA